jgi:hypothetical protein
MRRKSTYDIRRYFCGRREPRQGRFVAFLNGAFCPPPERSNVMKSRYAVLTAGLLLGTTLTGAALAQSIPGDAASPGITTGVTPEAPPTPLPSTDPMASPMATVPPLAGDARAQDQAASPAPDSVATGNQPPMEQGPRVLAEVDPDSFSGSDRQKNAQLSTQLLNRFNTLGFAEVKAFSREGTAYKTEARTPDGQWVTVMIDPQAGTITQQ